MATIFDIGLWDLIQPIFVFLLVFAVLFGVLTKIKFFGENNWINSFIAIIAAFLFTLMPAGREMISFILPWFVVLVLFLIGISKLYGPIFQVAGAEEVGWWASTKRVVFSPTFLGVIFFIVIASYAVRALATKE